jgi:DNA-binding NarL/FixJ family response regulator
MLQLRRFTAEQLAQVTGVDLGTIHTYIQRMQGLQSEKLAATGPGGRRNQYTVSHERARELRQELISGWPGTDSIRWDWEPAEATLVTSMPAELLAAELELLRCPPDSVEIDLTARRLRRANAFLEVSLREINQREDAPETNERWQTAKALANLIGEEILVAGSPSHVPNRRILDQATEATAVDAHDEGTAELQARIRASRLLSTAAPGAAGSPEWIAIGEIKTQLAHSTPARSAAVLERIQTAHALLTRLAEAPASLGHDDQLSGDAEGLAFLLQLVETELALESPSDFEMRRSAFRILSERLADLLTRGHVPDATLRERIQRSPLMSPFLRSLRDMLRNVQQRQLDLTIMPLVDNDEVNRITRRVSEVANSHGALARVVPVLQGSPVANAVRGAAEHALGAMPSSEALPFVLAAGSTEQRDTFQRIDDAVAAAADVAPVVLLTEHFHPYLNNLALKYHGLFVSMEGLETDALVSALRLDNKASALFWHGQPDNELSAGVLTTREREVAALLTEGLTNGEIARRLFISTKTASVHVSNIVAKLGVASRATAAAWAAREGITARDA